MTTFLFILLSLLALLWAWLALSPTFAWAFRYPINADTDAAKACEEFPAPADRARVPEGEWPAVTMIVPARNEAPVLEATIPTLCRQDYPDVRVILIDDQSDDDSPRILEKLREAHPNLTILHGSPRPEGWCGKPWAVTQAVREANTQWLLLTDADCFFHPRAVRQSMALAKAGGFDLVSFFPQITFGSTIERIGLSGLATVLHLIMPMKWANDPAKPLALVAGGFMLVRREVYDKVGGHEAVKAHLIEDVNLGRNIKASGARIHARLTDDLVSTRMYEGAADLWEGLAKNAYAGMEYQPRKFWVGQVITLIAAVFAPVYFVVTLVRALHTHAFSDWILFGLASVIVIAQVVVHSRATRHLRLPFWHVFSLPISAAIYGLISATSAWQNHFGGGNLWKGRRYDRQLLLSAVGPSASPVRKSPDPAHAG